MAHYIDKDALVAEIKNLENTYKKCPTRNSYEEGLKDGRLIGYKDALYKINTLEVKEVDIEGKQVWLEVDGFNHPNANKNKVYCVLTKYKLILAKVIGHHHDDELLQWKCTEFPFHRYDMREGDKYFEVQL